MKRRGRKEKQGRMRRKTARMRVKMKEEAIVREEKEGKGETVRMTVGRKEDER